MFGSLDVSTSALRAQRIQLDTIAGNIANMNATRDADGNPVPYRRRVAMFATGNPEAGRDAAGVHVSEIVKDPSPFNLVFDPDHPDAIKTGEKAGYVQMPNVDMSTEMINAMYATRIYEANVTVMDTTKSMIQSSLRLIG